MKLDINIISLVGYVILAIAFGLQVKNNLASNNTVLIVGSVVVVIGYLITGIQHGINIANKKLKHNYGHMILAVYYLSSFLFPMNNNRMDSDVLALVGHILLIRNNDSQFNLVGMTSLFGYFVLSIIRLWKNLDGLENKVMLAGSIITAAFLNIKVFQSLVKDRIKDNFEGMEDSIEESTIEEMEDSIEESTIEGMGRRRRWSNRRWW
jgi:hypothetical protein